MSEAIRLADALRDGTYLLSQERNATEAELRRQHAEIERLRGIVPEVLERLNDELCAENDRLNAQRRELQADRAKLLERIAQSGVQERRAVAQERLRCANVCENLPSRSSEYDSATLDCAGAIRRLD
jgi:hypothetical protein